LLKDLTVIFVPFTAEGKVLQCLFSVATAVWTVYFVDSMKVGFVVAMSNLELVDVRG
jgi:hypothetical protein